MENTDRAGLGCREWFTLSCIVKPSSSKKSASPASLSKAERDMLWRLMVSADGEGDVDRQVFVLLDGASVRQLPDFLEDEEVEHAPLIPPRNGEPEEITRATYLARVERDSTVSDWLLTHGWGANWGIWISAPAGLELEDLLSHLREMAQVRLPDGRIVYFRYYDPRIWRAFVPTCDMPQLKHLFSLPVFYGCESADGSSLVTDRWRDGAAIREEHPLDPETESE